MNKEFIMQRGRWLIIFGLSLGLVTISSIFVLVFRSDSQLGQEDAAEYIVALQPIPRGSYFLSGVNIGRRVLSISNPPPDVIAYEAETLCKVASIEISQGQPITRRMLVDYYPSPCTEDREELDRDCLMASDEAMVCFNRSQRYLYGVDQKTGQQRWYVREAEPLVFSTLTAADNKVYFWRSDETLHAIDAQTGQEIWQFQDNTVSHITKFTKPAAVDNYLLFWNFANQTVYALEDETGQEQWRFEINGLIQLDPTMIADGTVCLHVPTDGCVYALDIHTGQQRW